MSFEVKFSDGSIIWKPWDKDLSDTIQFEDFCRAHIELYPLLYDAKLSKKLISDMNRSPINEVNPGDTVLVNLRSYGATWYEGLPLSDVDHIKYVVEYTYTKWADKKHLKIHAHCKVFNEYFIVDHDFVYRYGQALKSDSYSDIENQLVLIDTEMVKKYPQLLK
jgi:hypothetical protein